MEPLSESELFEACQVHLVYLGNGVFGELKPRPFASTAPHPITLENLSLALQKVKGKGHPRSKPLDLSVSKLIGSLQVENITKGENVPATTGEQLYTLPVAVGSGPEIKTNTGDVVLTGKGRNDNINLTGQNDQSSSDNLDVPNMVEGDIITDNTVKTSCENEAGTKQPLVVIPPDFWLVQPQEIQSRDEAVVPENATGGNTSKERDSETSSASKHSVMSNVGDKVHLLFTNQAKQNKCFVLVEWMSPKFIRSFQPSQKSPEIDPYSSLKDIGTDQENVVPVLSETADVKPKVYNMRNRKIKRIRHSTKPERATRHQINYAELLSAGSDSDIERKRRSMSKPKVRSEPSQDRIAAQDQIVNKGLPKHRPAKPDIGSRKCFFRKDPNRLKPPHRKCYAKTEADLEDEPDPIKDDIYSGETEIDEAAPDVAEDHDTQEQPKVEPSKQPKGSFYTESHGLPKKRKPEQFFRCSECGTHKSTTKRLNAHFKGRHPPIQCDKCNMCFNTPSGLARHRYTHEEPRYSCNDCQEKFFFSYKLKQHRVTHLKVWAHFCNHGNCKQGFMNNTDLLKHVRMHTAEIQYCKHCDYSTRNPHLMTSHVKHHTELLQFQCDNCQERFRYRNQLRRHKTDPKKCPGPQKRSDSPEF